MQVINMFMDESGLINKKDKCSVYGGIWFNDLNKQKKFLKEYFEIIDSIKHHYCRQYKNICCCSYKKCPEIKNYNIESRHRQLLLELIFKHCSTYAVIVDVSKLKQVFKLEKGFKLKFREYIMKRIVVKVIEHELNNHNIDCNNRLNLAIDIDNMPHSLNLGYNLNEVLASVDSIITSNIDYDINYVNSKYHYLIQASDLLVGSIRSDFLLNKYDDINNKLDVKLYLP
ncbi:DUF3800 domain-containing protein [Mycoplasma sp. P36-A1]|uniref:DUF3800 domain-containing protein n=1 Tax=Mycoplasma sp. P36-A1 TaxID=3252900 RepID=UPI003C2D9069